MQCKYECITHKPIGTESSSSCDLYYKLSPSFIKHHDPMRDYRYLVYGRGRAHRDGPAPVDTSKVPAAAAAAKNGDFTARHIG